MKETIILLETSDLHGYLYSHNYANNELAPIGLTNLVNIIEENRRKGQVVLVDNGDTIQGSPLTYFFHKKYKDNKHFLASIMNKLHYDAVNVGNHDFNYGQKYLYSYTDYLNSPVVTGNIYREDKPLYKPYIIKEYNGIKIAITGVVTQYIPNWERASNIKGLQFIDAYVSLKKQVQYIREHEQVDLLIAMYHGGFERDIFTGEQTEQETQENQGYKMLKNIKGIDVLLTGHQHRSIAIDDLDGTSILQPANNGMEIAKLEIVFEKKKHWVITEKKATLIQNPMDKSNESLLTEVDPIEEKLQQWLNIPIGYLKEGNLLIDDLEKARLNKHDIVQFINDVQLDISNADISCNALANDVKGFNNQITYRDIISTYIYPNTLVVLEIDGKTLKELLHQNAQYYTLVEGEIKPAKSYVYPKPQHYNYDMYDGIEYTIVVGKTTTVEDITFHGKKMEDNQLFSLVLNNYRASGGGNFNMLSGLKVLKEIQVDMVEIIADYILNKKVIDVKNSNNITIKKVSNI